MLALDFLLWVLGLLVLLLYSSDLPVVGALRLRCAGLRLITLSVVLGSTYFLIPFFCVSVHFTFSQNLMLWMGWLGVETSALRAGVTCNGEIIESALAIS